MQNSVLNKNKKNNSTLDSLYEVENFLNQLCFIKKTIILKKDINSLSDIIIKKQK